MSEPHRPARRLRPFVWLLGGALLVTAGILAWQKFGPQPAHGIISGFHHSRIYRVIIATFPG